MEKSPIMQMYYGERGLYELINISHEYKELSAKFVDLEEELSEKLRPTPELLELFNKAIDTAMDMHCQYAADRYLEGFRFGALIGIDIMTRN